MGFGLDEGHGISGEKQRLDNRTAQGFQLYQMFVEMGDELEANNVWWGGIRNWELLL